MRVESRGGGRPSRQHRLRLWRVFALRRRKPGASEAQGLSFPLYRYKQRPIDPETEARLLWHHARRGQKSPAAFSLRVRYLPPPRLHPYLATPWGACAEYELLQDPLKIALAIHQL